MIYIYQHLGLGDHIICNGLVRNLIKSDNQYSMFVYSHNYESVKFMYRDLNNLSFIKSTDIEAKNIIKENKSHIVIGHQSYDYKDCTWDESFYKKFNLEFKLRYLSFDFLRDYESEKILFNKLNPTVEKYVLIHSKGSDGVDRINYEIINKYLKKIFVEKHTENIFDYMTLIENAEEIHCIESSFHHLVDSLTLHNKLYFHNNTNTRGFNHNINQFWKIV